MLIRRERPSLIGFLAMGNLVCLAILTACFVFDLLPFSEEGDIWSWVVLSAWVVVTSPRSLLALVLSGMEGSGGFGAVLVVLLLIPLNALLWAWTVTLPFRRRHAQKVGESQARKDGRLTIQLATMGNIIALAVLVALGGFMGGGSDGAPIMGLVAIVLVAPPVWLLMLLAEGYDLAFGTHPAGIVASVINAYVWAWLMSWPFRWWRTRHGDRPGTGNKQED